MKKDIEKWDIDYQKTCFNMNDINNFIADEILKIMKTQNRIIDVIKELEK